MNDANPATVSLPTSSAEPLFHPPAFFAHKDRVARWSLIGVCLSGLGHLLELAIILHLAGQPPFIRTLDPAGNSYGGRGRTFDEARDVQIEEALLTAHALLERSQSDFDLPELIQSMFSRPAREAAQALQTAEAQEFRDKLISQKVHPRLIEALDTKPDKVLVAVIGKLEREGVFQQQPFREFIPFKLLITFRLNPDFARAQQHPIIVEDFQLTYENEN